MYTEHGKKSAGRSRPDSPRAQKKSSCREKVDLQPGQLPSPLGLPRYLLAQGCICQEAQRSQRMWLQLLSWPPLPPRIFQTAPKGRGGRLLPGLTLGSRWVVPRGYLLSYKVVQLGKGEVTLKTGSQSVMHTYVHLFWHPFSWAQTKPKDAILSSGGCYLRMMFLLHTPTPPPALFWDFCMSPEKRLQYSKGCVNVKQRNPNTWTPFLSRPSHSSMLGLFCNLSLIRKCWKGLILALHQRQSSCTCTSLFIMRHSAAWQFTNQIYVAI